MPEIKDKEILELFSTKGKEEYAFSLLVKKYQEKLYWHCRRMLASHDDADDALQNTFIKVWKSLANFRKESELYTWLFRIATNESLTLLRKNTRHAVGIDPESEKYMVDSLTSDPYFDGDEIQLKLQKAIHSLPEKQKIVFNLKYYEDMKYEQMAEILDTSVGALKASYHHAVKKIEIFVKEN